jgi:CRISPR-associated protein Cas5h
MVIDMGIQAIKFTLSGRLAFFKKPDVNIKTYFTYNNIHKVALLGLLGSVIGLKGYQNEKIFETEKVRYPEFYEKLSSLKVSIVPNSERGYFSKKIQYFNNSVGYASNETGGNLMIFEQWLEDPSWTIYLLKDDNIQDNLWDKLTDFLLNGKIVYVPYLGKNDFHADISQVELLTLQPSSSLDFIHSLFTGELSAIDEDEVNDFDSFPFIFTEYAPVGLEENHNFYILKRTIFTNCKVNTALTNVYSHGNKNLSFY